MKTKVITTIMVTLFLASIMAASVKAQMPPRGPHFDINFVTKPKFFDDFEDPAFTSTAWTPIAGTWAVETDLTAPSPSHVYSQNDNTPGLGPQRSLAGEYSWTDYVVEVKAKGIEGYLLGYGTHTWVGLVFRAQDTTHFYEYYFRTAIPDIIVVKNDGGTRTVISGPVSFSCANGVWYTLKVVAEGDSFRFFVDGVEITGLAFTDTNSPFLNGKVGVLVFYGSHAHFDDVLVMGLNEILVQYDDTVPGLQYVLAASTSEFEVLDNDAGVFDGDCAVLQIPEGMIFDVYCSARGKPGGHMWWGCDHTREDVPAGKPTWHQHSPDDFDLRNYVGAGNIGGTLGPFSITSSGCTILATRWYPQ